MWINTEAELNSDQAREVAGGSTTTATKRRSVSPEINTPTAVLTARSRSSSKTMPAGRSLPVPLHVGLAAHLIEAADRLDAVDRQVQS